MSTSLSGFHPKTKIKGYDLVQTPNMDQSSMDLRNQISQGIQPGLNTGISRLSQQASGDEGYFKGLEGRAFEDFQRGLGQIGSRYAGVGQGAMSARNSSAFQNETTGAAGDLASKLSEQRLMLQQSALDDLIGLSDMIFKNQPYEFSLMEKQKKKKWWEKAIGGAAPVAGAIGGGIFGGPAGAALGAGLGSSFGSAFL